MKAGTLEIEMITNIARLQKEMGDMRRAVGGAMGDIEASAGRADRALNGVGTGGLTRMGGSARLAGHQVQNLVYQLNDMVVGLFSGQKPMTVFMQQGSQIGQIAMQAGLGIGGMARALVGLAATAAMVVLTNPYLLAAAAAAARVRPLRALRQRTARRARLAGDAHRGAGLAGPGARPLRPGDRRGGGRLSALQPVAPDLRRPPAALPL